MFRMCEVDCPHDNSVLPHGIIVTQGDYIRLNDSPPFYSQVAGLETLEGGIGLGRVLVEDRVETAKAIQASVLPKLEVEADVDVSEAQLVKQCAAFAVLAMFGGGIDAHTQKCMQEKSDALVRRREEIRSRNGR